MSTILFSRVGSLCTVRFRYDPALVDLLKAAVPSYCRTWNPSAKEWVIEAGFARELASAMRAAGHRVVGLDPPPQPRIGDTSQWAVLLLRRVGPTRKDPVFRALTKVLHPDNQKTGDTALQRELNDARAESEPS